MKNSFCYLKDANRFAFAVSFPFRQLFRSNLEREKLSKKKIAYDRLASMMPKGKARFKVIARNSLYRLSNDAFAAAAG